MRYRKSFPSPSSRATRVMLASACILGAAAVVVVAEQASVQRPKADVLDAKGSAGDVIETIPLNGTLEVLGHEGPWDHVRTPSGKVGYVPHAMLVKSNGGSDLAGITGSSTATPIGARLPDADGTRRLNRMSAARI